MMDHDAMGWSSGWWIAMWAMMGLFWLFVLAGIALLAVTLRRDHDARPRGESADEILARRLASGDIDDGTYRRLRREIRASGHPTSAH
jgi:uncharacterized membrane protein